MSEREPSKPPESLPGRQRPSRNPLPAPAHPVSPVSAESPQPRELRSRIEQQALLIQVNAYLAGAIDAEVVLGQILRGLARRAKLAHASIFLLDEEKQSLRLVAECGYETNKERRELALAGPGVVPYVARAAEPLYVPDVTKEAQYLCGHPAVRSEYAVPLRTGRNVLGVLNIESVESDGIRAVTQRLIDQIAPPTALALERSELYRKLRVSKEQLVMAQKMEAIGTLAGGLAHDFNNFLSVILGFASLVRNRLGANDPLREPVGMIERSAREAADLTRALLGLARHEEPHREPVDLKAVVGSVIKIARRTFDRRIYVESRMSPEPAWVRGDPTQLEQAILNLGLNARDAMPEGGELSLQVSSIDLRQGDRLLPAQHSPGRYVRLDVKDTGAGIDPSVLPRIFDAFFTTKGSGEGTGLGLAMVHAIVESHGGFLEVESRVGWGSRFSVFIRAVEPRKEQKSILPEKPDRIEEGSGTVLVVDDEPMVLAFAEQGLAKLGYAVLTAESGRRACEIYGSSAQKIDCVLLDLVMPDMSGFETYRRLRRIDPDVRVVLSSGYSKRVAAGEGLDLGAAGFLDKPYTLEALSRAIKKAHQN